MTTMTRRSYSIGYGPSTPWGRAQDVKTLSRGVINYSTAGHGGICVSTGKAQSMPEPYRSLGEQNSRGYWFEEDCAWAAVALSFPDLFSAESIEGARRTAKMYFPDAYEAVTGLVVPIEESHVKQEREFWKVNAVNLVSCAAWGDWHDTVPSGMVGVVANVGGRNNRIGNDTYWLIPQEEYRTGLVFCCGFVINPDKHEQWIDHA